MSWGYVAVAGATLVAGYMSSESQKDAAESAANAQSASAAAGIAEQRRQFDEIKKLLAPYVGAGTSALEQQQTLAGLKGFGSQQDAIRQIENQPGFLETVRQGENALLQNASATGGLRGGNIQAALSQFRPQMLNQAIAQQYGRLAGLTSLGQNAAAGVGNAGMQTGANVADLMGQQGAAMAGSALAAGQANAQMANLIPQAAGAYLGYQNRFGGNQQPSLSTSQQYGTVPGSEQTQMLQAQDAGF